MTESTHTNPNAFMKEIKLFESLSEEDLKALAKKSQIRTYQPGELIIHTGSGGHSLFVITAGKVQVTVEGGPKGQQVVASFSKGEFFGEMALTSHAHRTATVSACDQVQVLEFKASDIRLLLDKYEDMQAHLNLIRAKREKEHRAALIN